MLNNDEALTGKVLDFALEVIDELRDNDEVFDEMIKKLNMGRKLNAYEYHLLVEVFLIHKKYT